MFLGFLKKKQKKVENYNTEAPIDIIENKDIEVIEKKLEKQNNKPNIFTINSDIVSLLIDSNISVNVESTDDDSYYELVVDESAEIEKLDVIEHDKTLKIDLKVNKKKRKKSSSNSNVCSTSNVSESLSNIHINSSSNVCINNTTIGSISYQTDGNWKLNVYLNKSELKNLSVDSCSGDINIGITVQKIQINTVSGDIDCDNVTKEARLKSTSGDITFSCDGKYQTFNIDAASVSGDITIYLNNINQINKKVNTVSGDINFDYESNGDVDYNVKVNTVSGDITIQ